MRLLPSGDRAILVEFDHPREAAAFRHHLECVAPPHVVDVVPAERTVFIAVDSPAALEQLRSVVRNAQTNMDPVVTGAPSVRTHIVPVRYDGEDLHTCAQLLGLSPGQLTHKHTASEWRVSFVGFAPGFAYLRGQQGWNIPRRASPRATVPAGSVALAGPYCGIYPRQAPGGWQLIGRTDVTLWDDWATPPMELAVGDSVKFRAV